MSQDKKPRQAPSVGRVVHYSPPEDTGEVWTATIARVNSGGTVNLGGFDGQGHTFARSSVAEAPEGAEPGSEEARGCWAWPAFVPPASAKGGPADLQPTPRPSPTGEPQPPPRP